MKTIDGDTLTRLKRRVPDWVTAVDKSAAGESDGLIMTLDAFADDPQLLFDALWLAHDRGVAVTLAPASQTDTD